MNKIPDDAFTYYVGLGPERSYQAVADHYGVTKQGVVRLAKRDRWAQRLEKIERAARDATDQRLQESVAEMDLRHLKVLRAIQGKALEALRSMPLATAMEAVRALDMSIAKERLVRGEPSDRTAFALRVITNVDEPEA